MALKVSEKISSIKKIIPKKKKNCCVVSIPNLLEYSNKEFNFELVSIISGFDNTAINGIIDAIPIISIRAIKIIIKNNKLIFLRSLDERR